MSASEKFLKYVTYDTQSDASSSTAPSSAKQLILAEELAREMKDLGVSDVELTPEGIVYGLIPATDPEKKETIGFIAHMDTASELSGKDVKPRIIEHYDGGTIHLNEEYSMSADTFPELKSVIGDDIIVTDGTTLLGNDDKAGIAIIMQFAQDLLEKKPAHGPVRIAFTPDEEIGRGVENFDLEKFPCDYAFTVDGGPVECVDYETFNAAQVDVHFKGKSIHPGSAKNQMINAALVACQYAMLLPAEQTPAHTEGREGFFHLLGMEGECEEARLTYIIRDHDLEKFEGRKVFMQAAADMINAQYGPVCTIEIQDQYRNMKEYMHGDFRSVEKANAAVEACGYTPRHVAVRGGTDGAMLTVRGLNTPNLGTGGGNCHGRFEFASINKMNDMVQILHHIAED